MTYTSVFIVSVSRYNLFIRHFLFIQICYGFVCFSHNHISGRLDSLYGIAKIYTKEKEKAVMLLEHNKQTLDELERYIGMGKDCCVVNPCGSGKTSIMAQFVHKHSDKKIIILTKQKNAKKYYYCQDDVFQKLSIVTYNKMYKDYSENNLENYQADIYILDEAHYAGADKWGEALDFLIAKFKPLLVGFTATPQRYKQQGTEETIVTDLFGGNSAGNFTSRQLQQTGVFIEPEYILSLWNLQNDVEEKLEKIMMSDASDQVKQKWISVLNYTLDTWEKESSPAVILRNKLSDYLYKDKNNRILVYTPSIKDIPEYRQQLDQIITQIVQKSIKSYIYTYKDSESTLTRFISDKDDTYVKILYSIDKIMETIHIDDLNIIIMLRPSISNRIITQQFGRVNSIGNDKKSLIIDMVDNLSNINTARFTNGINKDAEPGHFHASYNINLQHISPYRTLFDNIDSVFSKSYSYKYREFYGNLSQVAKVCGVSYADLYEKCYVQGMEVEDAVKKLPKIKAQVTRQIFAGFEDLPEFTLSSEQTQRAQRLIPTMQRFITRRHIKDEDIIQTLYMNMLYLVYAYQESDAELRQRVLNMLNKKYPQCYAHKYMREALYCEESYNTVFVDAATPDILSNHIIAQEIQKCTDEYLQHPADLSAQEKQVIDCIFGLHDEKPKTLYEVAQIMNLSHQRISQIKQKALRQLRFAPGSVQSLKERYLMYCNG